VAAMMTSGQHLVNEYKRVQILDKEVRVEYERPKVHARNYSETTQSVVGLASSRIFPHHFRLRHLRELHGTCADRRRNVRCQ
jgi:hypothetical protein